MTFRISVLYWIHESLVSFQVVVASSNGSKGALHMCSEHHRPFHNGLDILVTQVLEIAQTNKPNIRK